MGVDTTVKLNGKVTQYEIADFIQKKYGATVSVNGVSMERRELDEDYKRIIFEYYEDKDNLICISGFIDVRFKDGHTRNIFYDYRNVNFWENLDYYSEYGLEDMVKSETTYLSLGHDEEAEKIMLDIVEQFGGWYTKNDCEAENTVPISGKNGIKLRPIIHISHEELNNKYDAIVIVDD